jgi:hypothetical protein
MARCSNAALTRWYVFPGSSTQELLIRHDMQQPLVNDVGVSVEQPPGYVSKARVFSEPEIHLFRYTAFIVAIWGEIKSSLKYALSRREGSA